MSNIYRERFPCQEDNLRTRTGENRGIPIVCLEKPESPKFKTLGNIDVANCTRIYFAE